MAGSVVVGFIFFFFLAATPVPSPLVVTVSQPKIKWNQSLYYSFPLAAPSPGAFHGVETAVKTL